MLGDFNREGLGIKLDFSLPAERDVRNLDRIVEWRGKPGAIWVDNGPLHPRNLMQWAWKQDVIIRPIQPAHNTYFVCYYRTIRPEWPDQYIVATIEEAQDFASQWHQTYKSDRPKIPFMLCSQTFAGQRDIGGMTPAQKLKMAA